MSPSLQEITRLEENIRDVKSGISSISFERWQAALMKDENKVLEARIRAAEKMLENCDLISRYVSQFCPAIGRDLSTQEKIVQNELERIKEAPSDHGSLHIWYKANLVPLVKKSETVAHVAATSHRRAKRLSDNCHKWPLSARTSSTRRVSVAR